MSKLSKHIDLSFSEKNKVELIENQIIFYFEVYL